MRTSGPSEHLRKILRDDETVAWSAKPDKTAFYTAGIVGGLFMAGFLGVFFGIPGLMATAVTAAAFGKNAAIGTAGVLALLALVGVPTLIWWVTRRSYHFTEYAVTDDRVIETSGVIGRDASSVALEDVKDIDVNVGLLGKFFDTGKLSFQTAGGQQSGASFSGVENPYDVLEKVEEQRSQAGGS